MSKEKVIALTGGGTAGHVMPHLAMLDDLNKNGYKLFYIGSNGIEKDIISSESLEYVQIASGKLRRYWSFQNFLDIFKVIFGTLQSVAILLRRKPRLVYSKGGFVSVPVAVAAWILRIPVISHESDYNPGLANKIISRFAKKIFYSFPETKKFLPSEKAVFTGIPVRQILFQGDKAKGYERCGFSEGKTILVMGGSLGAQKINDALLEALPQLVDRYQVAHITGKGKGIPFEHPRYKSFEFISEGLEDIFAIADVIVSRAGANSIFEFLALRKIMLLIPLEQGSRGDQVLNANCFADRGWAQILLEKDLSPERLLERLRFIENNEKEILHSLDESMKENPANVILSEIGRYYTS